jgi:hypothetical protein
LAPKAGRSPFSPVRRVFGPKFDPPDRIWPGLTVPDNAKAAIAKACFYEPDLQRS